MKRGDKVIVLGVLTSEGEPMPCTLGVWHPNPYATGRSTGEWDFETEDGRYGCRPVDDISPWRDCDG